MVSKTLWLIAGLLCASMAHAVCYRDGRAYPTGTIVGDFICQPDGTWRRR
ncbi:hypothetical protein [Variovorax sp. J22R115]|nr:hypothetical protein [Variovorax sp. J22R115]MDM0053544.1 hypothetical protein [Variovorax sp. J22R115]